MPIIKCLVCGKEKLHKLSRIKKGGGKFCSLTCYYKFSKSHLNKGTFKKGKHYSSKTEFKKGNHYSTKTEFKKGQPAPAAAFKCGDKHPYWNGGRCYDTSGYIHIYSPNHPFCDKQRYVQEHRLIAEKILNRYLDKSEVIHHINGIKDDNCPENLYLFSIKNLHSKFHSLKNKPILKSNI